MESERSVALEVPFVRREDAAGVVTLTLDRGARINPLSSGMIDALEHELDRLQEEPDARVVVLGGAGRGFCAGHDLQELRTHLGDAGWQRDLFANCARL